MIGEHWSKDPAARRSIAAMRFILALSALLVVYSGPPLSRAYSLVTWAVLIAYTLYSAVAYVMAVRGSSFLRADGAGWPDLAWYALLLTLTGGESNVFSVFYLFAVMTTSFRWGLWPGVSVALALSLFLVGAGVVHDGDVLGANADSVLLRPLYLLALGSLIAQWGDLHLNEERQLALLRSVARLSGGRFGISYTVSELLELVRAHFDAPTCLFVTSMAGGIQYRLLRTDRSRRDRRVRDEPITPELANQLLAVPSGAAVVFSTGARRFGRPRPHYEAYQVATGARCVIGQKECEVIAAMLNADAFASVPVSHSRLTPTRLFITSDHRGYSLRDLRFLEQVVSHIVPVLDNIRLIDGLAREAALEERRRVARDIHDSAIQPYIGLQMGLSVVRQKLADGFRVNAEIDRLISMSDESIAALRRYVADLRASAEDSDRLAPSLRRFATRFGEATGIDVQVEVPANLNLRGSIVDEIFQMTVEGLSNIRRHSHADSAQVCLERGADGLCLSISNNDLQGRQPSPFVPNSITERARSLGGSVRVEPRKGGGCVVRIDVPL